jgi:hypothetical protein
MTTKADFTEEEWHQIAAAPTGVGLLVASASRGGTFRESFSIAKSYSEARAEHGESELLDELVGSKPVTDRGGAHTGAELNAHVMEMVNAAVAALQAKATPEELADYRKFVHGLAERVAAAHSEKGQDVSPAEQAAIDQIDEALGG